jgi:hypothetical protein
MRQENDRKATDTYFAMTILATGILPRSDGAPKRARIVVEVTLLDRLAPAEHFYLRIASRRNGTDRKAGPRM